MKVALIVTTYNWPKALNCVLSSVLTQTRLPDEVIVADDGSTEETRTLIEQYQTTFPVPLKHSWHKDNGFQLATSRNKAIAMSECDYIIMVDGDMLLSKTFIETHIHNAKENFFVQGGRVLVSHQTTEKVMLDPKPLHCFSQGIKNRHNAISQSWLSQKFSKEKNNDRSTRGCNMAFWKKDVIECNGFNEDFVGWGREDSEFVHRMLNNGHQRLYLKFAAVAYHLFHPENERKMLEKNDEILAQTIKQKLTFCQNGIDKYLD